MVHQQIRALQIFDTAVARQKGFPQRVSFQEFLRRYWTLTFESILILFEIFKIYLIFTSDTSFWHLILMRVLI